MNEQEWADSLMERPENFAAHVDLGQFVEKAPVSYRPDDASPLLASNHRVMVKRLAEFGDDVVETSERHWAVGMAEALYVQVRRGGEFTPAWREACRMLNAIVDYPVLDESDLAEAEMENLVETVRGCVSDFTDGHDVETDTFVPLLVDEYLEAGGEMYPPSWATLLTIAASIRERMGHVGDWMECPACE